MAKRVPAVLQTGTEVGYARLFFAQGDTNYVQIFLNDDTELEAAPIDVSMFTIEKVVVDSDGKVISVLDSDGNVISVSQND